MIRANIAGVELRFETAEGLFSPRGVDAGTLAMLSKAVIGTQDKVLDLGCGYGVVGIYAAALAGPERVWMVDIDPAAVAQAHRNLKLNGVEGVTAVVSDGFAGLAEAGFTKILCNPPYHVDFAVPKRLIEKGFNRLAVGGTLWMVTRRDDWYRNKLRSIFGRVRTHMVDGYGVFEAVKTSSDYAKPPKGRRASRRISGDGRKLPPA